MVVANAASIRIATRARRTRSVFAVTMEAFVAQADVAFLAKPFRIGLFTLCTDTG